MEEEDKEKNPRKNWDLMIGITLVLLGSIRLYNRMQAAPELSFRAIFTLGFIIFGAYLIFRYFSGTRNKQ